MSLPIIMLFERHWDSAPKHLIETVLPKLKSIRYDTIYRKNRRFYKEAGGNAKYGKRILKYSISK